MQSKFMFFLAQYVIFHRYYKFGYALVGLNVRQAIEGEFTNVVGVLRISNNKRIQLNDFRCTGTLLTHDHILTSEHCTDNMGTDSLYVLAESVDLRRARPYYISWWITYNLWANSHKINLESSSNDIAILKLILKVPETIVPASLVTYSSNSLWGLNVTLAGWSKVENNRNNPFIMRTVQVKIISKEECEGIVYRGTGQRLPVDERYLCTIADPPAHVTKGDSGGPMFFANFIVGINQGTIPETPVLIDPRKANFHDNLNNFKDFINNLLLI